VSALCGVTSGRLLQPRPPARLPLLNRRPLARRRTWDAGLPFLVVTSFSQEHAPPPRLLGPEIPAGVRRAITTWFAEHGVDAQEIRLLWSLQAGYGNAVDVAADVRDRWGEVAQALMPRDLEGDNDILRYPDERNQRAAFTAAVFLHVPAPLYLDYLELAIEKYARDRALVQVEYVDIVEDLRAAPVDYLNGLFARRGIDYRFDENGRARWHGDAGAYAEVIRPALDALEDGCLAGPRQEFESALGHLRAGTPKDLEDAIEEAGKAVESAMKVVLDSHEVTRAGNETAEPLWNLLRENDLVPAKSKDAILSTSRLRNEYGGHGQGAEIREIPAGIPALAVRSAAATIAYLAELLP
jgi:hypothetical protein